MRRNFSLFTGFSLLAWQGAAAFLSVVGAADTMLAQWPDASWYATALAVALSPPRWLVWMTLIAGVGFLVSARPVKRSA